MRSTRAREYLGQMVDNRADLSQGLGRSVMRFGAASMSSNLITDMGRMPVVPTGTQLQRTDGKFIFLVGYSAVGGGDVVG